MALLATITQTVSTSIPSSAAGNIPFDDLANTLIGQWPNTQNVKAIKELIFYTDNPISKVVGFDVTYDLHVGTPVQVTHGKQTDFSTSFTVKPTQLVTGIYGQLDDATKRIASINVVIFDTKEGKVVVKGPIGKEIDGPQKVYGSFGNIIAFAGQEIAPAGLLSLSFYKSGETLGGVLLP